MKDNSKQSKTWIYLSVHAQDAAIRLYVEKVAEDLKTASETARQWEIR